MFTIDLLDCGEQSCEYCSKDKCIYMTGEDFIEEICENIEEEYKDE